MCDKWIKQYLNTILLLHLHNIPYFPHRGWSNVSLKVRWIRVKRRECIDWLELYMKCVRRKVKVKGYYLMSTLAG